MSRRVLYSLALVFAASFLHAQQSPAPPAPAAPQEIPPPQPSPPQLSEIYFKNLKARAIGPTIMGGRISDIAIDPRNPGVFFVGTATGGIFKTGDSGASFDPIFDKESALSIGAIAIAPSDSDII